MTSLKRISRSLAALTATIAVAALFSLTTSGSASAQTTSTPVAKQTPAKSTVGAAEGGVTYYYQYNVRGGGIFSCPGNFFYPTPFGMACKGNFIILSKCVGGRIHSWYRGAIFNLNTATVGALGPLRTHTRKC